MEYVLKSITILNQKSKRTCMHVHILPQRQRDDSLVDNDFALRFQLVTVRKLRLHEYDWHSNIWGDHQQPIRSCHIAKKSAT